MINGYFGRRELTEGTNPCRYGAWKSDRGEWEVSRPEMLTWWASQTGDQRLLKLLASQSSGAADTIDRSILACDLIMMLDFGLLMCSAAIYVHDSWLDCYSRDLYLTTTLRVCLHLDGTSCSVMMETHIVNSNCASASRVHKYCQIYFSSTFASISEDRELKTHRVMSELVSGDSWLQDCDASIFSI